jgi:hypothetical protein
MKSVNQFVRQVIQRNLAAVGILLAVITLSVDFATGREIRFPLLYIIPIAMMAWLDKKPLAYAMSVLLPLVRAFFENYWHNPDTPPTEALNAAIEALALCLYVYLVSRQAEHTMQLSSTITTSHFIT